MSLILFERFLVFAEQAASSKPKLPTEIDSDELNSALVSYGVVLLHSHMEQCLQSAMEIKCQRCSDPEVRAFALSIRDDKTGKIGLDALKQTLKRFSQTSNQAFKDYLVAFGGDAAWESIRNNRHTIGHYGTPASCSLADLRSYYGDIRRVLGFYCDVLGLTSAEVASISSLIVLPTP